MKHIILLLFIILGITFNSNACLNLYYTTDKEGHAHVIEERIPAFNINFNHQLIDKKLNQLMSEMEQIPSFQTMSDYAVLLMKAGKIDVALELLQQISIHHPNEYRIAANLGTAYELNGELDSALFYIRKGIELNPNAHDGSEWIHIRILETKKSLLNDPDYLAKNTVLRLSEDALKNEATADQLLLQLQERFPFMPNRDAIKANLFYDLGRCFVETKSLQYAEIFFEISYKYFGGNEAEAKEKIAEVQALIIKNDQITPEIADQYNGDLRKLSIQYKHLFDDNNNPPHQINWDDIVMNVKDILALNHLSYTKIKKQIPLELATTNMFTDSTQIIQKGSIDNILSKSTNNTLFFTLIVAVSLILVALYFIRRGKK